jgi:outer membrane protein TolC
MRTKRVIYLLLMVGLCTTASAQERRVLTLNNCFDYAFKNSYDLRKAALGVWESDAAHRESKAALLPQLSGTASLTGNIEIAAMLNTETGVPYRSSIDRRADLHDKTGLKILDGEKTAASLELSRHKNGYLPTLTLGASSGYSFEPPELNPGKFSK